MVNTRKLIIKAEKGEEWEDKGEGRKVLVEVKAER